jgi:hypothetical protein
MNYSTAIWTKDFFSPQEPDRAKQEADEDNMKDEAKRKVKQANNAVEVWTTQKKKSSLALVSARSVVSPSCSEVP